MSLPKILLGHWASPDGLDMAMNYASMTRDQLCGGSMTDMAAAYYVAMIGRGDLDHEARLHVGKDRIRWLSVQLALRDAQLAEAMRLLDEAKIICDAVAHPPKIRIGITVDGGVVDEVWSVDPLPDVQVVVIDKDTESSLGDDIVEVRDGRNWEEAMVTVFSPEHQPRRDWSADFRDTDEHEPFNVFGEDPQPDLRPIAPGEYERSIMSGYSVEANGFGEGWFVRDAEGDELNTDAPFATERDAWEAADNHRMFGSLEKPQP